MELHQLGCFLAVIEEGSFNKAAIRLHRTQPAISYQIKQLETELGLPLFHRRLRRVSPTEAGRVLEQHAREIIEKVQETERALEALSGNGTSELRIGTVNSVGIHFLPGVLRNMRKRCPTVRPTVLYRTSSEIIDALLSDRVDIALVANPRTDRRLQQETIMEERISLVCGPNHPFCGRDDVAPEELKGLSFISLTGETPTGELIRDYLARIGVEVESVVSTDNVETVRQMVEAGLGVALLPDMVTNGVMGCYGEPSRACCRIHIGKPLTRTIVMLTCKDMTITAASTTFVDELRSHGARWTARNLEQASAEQ